MNYKIQRGLIQSFPGFNDPKNLIDYYVSFEFPDKQRSMAAWWEAVLEHAIGLSGQLSLSPADLQLIFSVHKLKPIPLQNILKFLQKEGKIEWEGKPVQKSGWLTSMVGRVWGTKNQKQQHFSKTQKITILKYKNEQKKRLKSLIEYEMNHENIIDYQYITSKIEKNIDLSDESISLLMTELQNQKWLAVDSVENKKVLLYSSSPSSFSQEKWINVEKSKYILRQKIQYFQFLMSKKNTIKQTNRANAKECLQQNNKAKAKALIQDIQEIDKILTEFNSRKKLLEQTLHQLQLQEIDSITIDTMKNCQEVIQKTKIDMNQLEEVKEKNMQINMNQKQVNQHLKDMDEENNYMLDQQVDKLMAELQGQISKDKIAKKGENVVIPIHVEQKEQQMDIE